MLPIKSSLIALRSHFHYLSNQRYMGASFPILISDQVDYEILDQFFKMGIYEEEYGYVLEGLKPISIRNFISIEDIYPYQELAYEKKQFKDTLLT